MSSDQASPRRCFSLGRFFFGLTILFAGFCFANSAQAQLTPEKLIGDSVSNPDASKYSDIASAIQRFTNRDVPGCQLLLESAVRKDPKLPPTSVLLAKMYLLSGNGGAIRPALEQSATEAPDDPEPFLLLAEDAFQTQRTIEADALFDKAAQLIEKYDTNLKRKRSFVIRAYQGRAAIAERRKNWAQAKSDLERWLEQDPDNAGAHNRLGQMLFMLEDAKGGFAEFQKAKKLNADLANPYVSAAVMYERRGEAALAKQAFEQAYSQDKSAETTLVAYAQSLVRSGDLKKGAQVLKQAQSAAPNSFNVWLLSGVTARMAGDSDAAEKYFMKALSLQPGNRDVYNQLALVLIDRPDELEKQRAVQFASANARIHEKNPDVQVTLAWTLFNVNRGREATMALRSGLQGGALSADGSLLVAKMLLARDQKDSAKRLLTGALANDQGIFVGRVEAEKLLGEL